MINFQHWIHNSYLKYSNLIHFFWQSTGSLFQEILKYESNVFKQLFNILNIQSFKVVFLIFCFGILGNSEFSFFLPWDFFILPCEFSLFSRRFLYSAAAFFILPWVFFRLPWVFFILPLFSLFCRRFLYSAVSILCFAVTLFMLPWL